MDESTRAGSLVPDNADSFAAAETRAHWEHLVRRCAKGDQGALSALYDQSSPLVYGVALRILSKPEDAEEVTVDVYNQVWRSSANFDRSRGSVTSWLIVLARSRAIDRIRARATRERREEPIEEHTTLQSSGDNPEESTRVGQLSDKVRAALAVLSAEHRRAVELAFFSGLSHAELAERLGIPLGTAKTRIRTSMNKLRESLGEYA
jgi:RNA polymerase sigma-70 factor (ECF subfamily)